MKPLTMEEKLDLAYFIRFCDGIYDKRGSRYWLLSGSGIGEALLGDVFNDKKPKATMQKCLRRGYIERRGRRYAPTDKGREVAQIAHAEAAEKGDE